MKPADVRDRLKAFDNFKNKEKKRMIQLIFEKLFLCKSIHIMKVYSTLYTLK